MFGGNKKRTGGGYVPGPFAVVVIVVSAAAIGYLWLDVRCETVGRELKRLESRMFEAERQYANEQYLWTQTRSPASVERALRRHNIAMTWPENSRVVHLTVSELDPGLSAGNAGANGEYARVARKAASTD